MSLAEELRPFGVFVAESFLTADESAALEREMRAGAGASTPVYLPDAGGYVEADHVRSVRTVAVSDAVRSALEARFDALLAELGAHFGVELTSREPLSFLRYGPGDHFEAHRDVSDQAEARHAARIVSLVLFVNSGADPEAGAAGAFVGGELVLCVFGDDPRAALLGIPVTPRAGTLVAFRSDLVHQVAPVTEGERCTVVTWAGRAAAPVRESGAPGTEIRRPALRA